MLRKILRRIFLGLLILVSLILLFALVSIGLVDRTPARQLSGYQQTFGDLKNLKLKQFQSPDTSFAIGFSKVNLTPEKPVALAGYGNRKGKYYTSVADSIFIRTIVIDNGTKKVAIVSADLLLIPPKVTLALQNRLADVGFVIEDVFLGATHTHNSIGNWGEGAAGFLYGSYEDSMIDFITSKIIRSISLANSNLVNGTIRFGKIDNAKAVGNRLVADGPEDPYIRLLEFNRADSSKLIFLSYTAHATCLYSRNLELSRDYPGRVVDDLENNGYDFAMFMAGAVGSHKPAAPEFGWTCFDWMADELVGSVLQYEQQLVELKGTSIASIKVPLQLSDPQVKITPNLKVRSWLFRSALGEYPVYVSSLQIGNVLMFGTPADFSGEFNPSLDSLVSERKQHLITTSFNGGYIGYLTPEKYYDNKYFETQLMNWYAPGTGEFIRDVMAELIKRQPSD